MSDRREFFLGTIGIPWCRKEDYDALLAISEDAKDLPATWEGFAQKAEQAEDHWQAQGSATRRVNIHPRTFADWCARKGYRIDAEARLKFAFEAINPPTENHR